MSHWFCYKYVYTYLTQRSSPEYSHSGQNLWRSEWSGSGCPSAQDTFQKFPEWGRGWDICSASGEPWRKHRKINTEQLLSTCSKPKCIPCLKKNEMQWVIDDTRGLTLCRCLGRSRRRRCVSPRLAAERRRGWYRGRCSCWSRLIGCYPMTHPVKRKNTSQAHLRNIYYANWQEFILTFIWEIHFSSMLKPTCSGTAWNIWE